jgi:hypothetical protein
MANDDERLEDLIGEATADVEKQVGAPGGHDASELYASRDVEALAKAHGKRQWHLLESSFIQGDTDNVSEFARLYGLPKRTVTNYARRHAWKKKQHDYRVLVREANREALSGQAFSMLFRKIATNVIHRAAKVLQREATELEDDEREDTVADVHERSRMVNSIAELGAMAFGDMLQGDKGASKPVFEVIITPTAVKYVEIAAGDGAIDVTPSERAELRRGETSGPAGLLGDGPRTVTTELPAGMTESEVRGEGSPESDG